MDFSLSPEQEAVQEKAQRLAREVRGLSARLDREARFPREILHLWAKGFFVNGLCPLPTNNCASGGFFRKETLWPERD